MVSKSRYASHSSRESECPVLGNARVVVTEGRALESAENFKMMEKLAAKVVQLLVQLVLLLMQALYPMTYRLGKLGRLLLQNCIWYLVFMELFNNQHLAEKNDSKVIVVVNKDAYVPIFQVADYGLVGDLFEIIPELLEKFSDKK